MSHDHIYTHQSVLWAVMSTPTPFGAITDRLASHHQVPEVTLDKNRLMGLINDLHSKELIVITHREGPLYRKVLHAMSKLKASEDIVHLGARQPNDATVPAPAAEAAMSKSKDASS